MGAVGTLMRGVARLDPTSILVAGLMLGGFFALVVYSRGHLARRRREPDPRRSVKVSDARLYGRYREITGALERAGVAREDHETPEEYARRAAETVGNPSIARLGEIYLYARFRDAVPAALVEEFDHLEPAALASIENLKEAASVRS